MKKATIAWALGVGLLLVYELWAITNSVPNDTLSEAIWHWGQHPMVALVVGILVGHFWWQRKCGD
jgi:hypothetical protein